MIVLLSLACPQATVFQYAMNDLRANLVSTLNDTPMSFSFSDIEKVQAGIGDKISIFIRSITTFIAGFVIGFITNWKLALVISVMLPVIAFMTAISAKVSIFVVPRVSTLAST